ncbi:T9SS type A sorting domain-containing protein [Hymenobacter rubidus]|uniref:T9SS type A sorting domain-containing protein n=1 Tax=Hymenobacter rubidus TaxID=1441626 RepID=UPI00191F3A54|nr:T9SS type A sorting domain-containing protein [Hymenobacter rubidus]
MKTLTRFTLALAASLLSLGATQGQAVANLDLETWATRTTSVSGGVEAPANWLTDDDFSAEYSGQPQNGSYNTLVKTTDANSGSYAAKLITDASGYASYFVLGTRVATASPNSYGGVPFTSRPAQLQFYYKLAGASAVADSAYVLLELTRTVNGASQTVGFVSQYLTSTATSYTLASFPITYNSATTAAPDSAHLVFVSGTAANITTGTTVYIDDINLGNAVTATRNPALNAALSVAPNPSPNGVFTLSSTEPALLGAPYTVTDALGRVVAQGASVAATATRQLELPTVPAGLYTLQLRTAQGIVTRKLVVQ